MKRNIIALGMGAVILTACTARDISVNPARKRLGVQTGNYARGAVNGLEGLHVVGDRIGIYAVHTSNPAAAFTPLTTEWTRSPLMNTIQSRSIDINTGAISWASHIYTHPQADT